MAISVEALKKYQEKMLAGLALGEEDALDDTYIKAAAEMSSPKFTKYTKDDIRFPNTNMGASCWTALNEWQLCTEKFGKEEVGKGKAPQCFQRYRDWKTICPADWVASYEEQASNGKYMGVDAPRFQLKE